MYALESILTGEPYSFSTLEQELTPLGFKLADNWDYDHGYFDCQLANEEGYHFLRIPFTAVSGDLDSPTSSPIVRVGEPFLLTHLYQDGIDDHVREGNFRAMIDQFQEPKDKDAKVPEKFIPQGRELLQEVESRLSSNRD
ncbi:YugN-like family protein [Halobacillus sp. Marseille-Q1614]|uniref:YugN-like family protein n=1 Tax=Halobacillus sp. Marseille-Q1614 TaxID=2709134 RepID=UPI00156F0725|nr:YugN-like family protein [Halobacillus sp. Marseille-Q1614]